MRKVVVAVGSTRPPKLKAVSDALQSFGAALDADADFEVTGIEVTSGVSHTPRSRGELMAGARGRVEALLHASRERNERWAWLVGLEGGLEIVHENGRRLAFLESWAFVSDGGERDSWGYAGGVELPPALAAEVLDNGVELSAAIDAFAGVRGVRDAQGAWGVLTRNIITRQDVLRTAVVNAFAPFFNPALYSR
jgi:inosine/xanthosine triphosphatase